MIKFLKNLTTSPYAKGVADNINTQVALKRKADYEADAYMRQLKSKSTFERGVDVAARTENLFSLGKTPISYIKSNAASEDERVMENGNSVIAASLQPISVVRDGVVSEMPLIDYLLQNGETEKIQAISDHFSRYAVKYINSNREVSEDGKTINLPANLSIYKQNSHPFWNKLMTELTVSGVYKHKPSIDYDGNYNVGTVVGNGDWQVNTAGPLSFDESVSKNFKSFWPEGHSMHKQYSSKDVGKLMERLNNNRKNPFTERDQIANYYYWGLGEDTPENTFPRQFMLRVAADLEPILSQGFNEAMRPQNVAMLKEYFGHLQEAGIQFSSADQLVETLGEYFKAYDTSADNPQNIRFRSFESVGKSLFGIEKVSDLTKMAANINKPLRRVKQLIKIVEPAAAKGEFPSPVIRRLTLFGNAIKELPTQLSSAGKILTTGQNIIGSIVNRITGLPNDVEGIEKDAIVNSMNQNLEHTKQTMSVLEDMAEAKGMTLDEFMAQSDGSFTEEEQQALTAADFAVIDYHMYLLAFEMAASAQGGGDSRTISDRDVRIMQMALRQSWLANGKDFAAVLKQVRSELSKTAVINDMLDLAYSTSSIPHLKATKLYKSIAYGRASGWDEDVIVLAEQISKSTVAQLENEVDRVYSEKGKSEEIIKPPEELQLSDQAIGSLFDNSSEFVAAANNLTMYTDENVFNSSITSYRSMLDNVYEDGSYKSTDMQAIYNAITDIKVRDALFDSNSINKYKITPDEGNN